MSKTFCIVPFTQIATERNGDYIACCASKCASGYNVATDRIEDVWNSDYYIELRKALSNDIQHPNCQTCWEAESLGARSRRQESNADFDGVIKEYPTILDIKVGNVCNLKCITCNQLASSLHDKEVQEWKAQGVALPTWLAIVEDQYTTKDISNVSIVGQNLDSALKNASNIMLQGGETFMNPMTNELLGYCAAHGYVNPTVEGVINLTSLTDANIDLISKFPNFKLLVSWDHCDADKFSYIRYPANYAHFQKNLDKLINKKIFYGVSFTLSVFNALDLETIFESFKGMSFITVSPCLAPDYFSAEYLELAQKEKVINSINVIAEKGYITSRTKERLLHLIDRIPADFDEVVKERTRVLDLYDQTRNTDYRALFPFIKRYE